MKDYTSLTIKGVFFWFVIILALALIIWPSVQLSINNSQSNEKSIAFVPIVQTPKKEEKMDIGIVNPNPVGDIPLVKKKTFKDDGSVEAFDYENLPCLDNIGFEKERAHFITHLLEEDKNNLNEDEQLLEKLGFVKL